MSKVANQITVFVICITAFVIVYSVLPNPLRVKFVRTRHAGHVGGKQAPSTIAPDLILLFNVMCKPRLRARLVITAFAYLWPRCAPRIFSLFTLCVNSKKTPFPFISYNDNLKTFYRPVHGQK